MTHTGAPGFRVLPSPPGLDPKTLVRFQGLASSNLADAMGRFGFMDAAIVMRSGLPVSGPAVTVLCRPGDNLMVHKALQMAQPGDVIVVSTCGNRSNAVFGELMCRTALACGVAGIVVDGAVRDVDGLTTLGFPAFSRTLSPGACDKDGPGEINTPISCGGVVVSAGDVVVGDRDGVVVVPRGDVDHVLREVEAIAAREQERIAEIRNGKLFRPEIDDLLKKKGVIR